MELKQNYVIERMYQLLKERDWTVYRLAKESGLAYSSLNNIFVRNTVPSVFTLEKICNGFQITLSQFFDTDTPIINVSDMLNSDERHLIETYRTLSKSDRQLLNAYLNGLAKRLSDNL
ncbi:MAG: helix-turn-helix transcriptional regulator [Oscillospiraceae bacterium]|nr:helix-turn-helix transcriptional regulator [Oscillospiraceae bacterium]